MNKILAIAYSPNFVRKMNKLENDLIEEVFEKIALLKDSVNHRLLKVHKLHGKYKQCYSFSVNYKIRVIFMYLSKSEVELLAIDNHDGYR